MTGRLLIFLPLNRASFLSPMVMATVALMLHQTSFFGIGSENWWSDLS